jgi:ribosomal protein S12 methylthiotransferase
MAEGKILPYLDIPFQHASPRVLKAMRRPANQDKMLERIAKWRAICPELTIRSSFIVGFPGETEEDFETLLDFIEEAQIDRAGCFKYENVSGAASSALEDHVDEDVKQDRWDAFMEVQTELAYTRSAALVGQTMTVLVDSFDAEEGRFEARTKGDAPEIDGVVYIAPHASVAVSDFAQVRIVSGEGHELFAEAVG